MAQEQTAAVLTPVESNLRISTIPTGVIQSVNQPADGVAAQASGNLVLNLPITRDPTNSNRYTAEIPTGVFGGTIKSREDVEALLRRQGTIAMQSQGLNVINASVQWDGDKAKLVFDTLPRQDTIVGLNASTTFSNRPSSQPDTRVGVSISFDGERWTPGVNVQRDNGNGVTGAVSATLQRRQTETPTISGVYMTVPTNALNERTRQSLGIANGEQQQQPQNQNNRVRR
jgi:hypothetical protein